MTTPGIRRAPALPSGRPGVRWRESGGLEHSTRGGREPALADLVEQRLVADLENAGRLGPISVHLREHFRQGLALGVSRPASRYVSQALACHRALDLGRPVHTAA